MREAGRAAASPPRRRIRANVKGKARSPLRADTACLYHVPAARRDAAALPKFTLSLWHLRGALSVGRWALDVGRWTLDVDSKKVPPLCDCFSQSHFRAGTIGVGVGIGIDKTNGNSTPIPTPKGGAPTAEYEGTAPKKRPVVIVFLANGTEISVFLMA